MKYVVEMNGNYMNSFKSYNQAYELRKQLERTFKNARVEIISIY